MEHRALHPSQARRLPAQLGGPRHGRRAAEGETRLDRRGRERRIRLGSRCTQRRSMTYSSHLLPPNARPTSQDFAGLADPDIIWEDARWWRVTERTDLHEVRYLEVRDDGQAVARAPLLITTEPGGLLVY